MSTIGEWIDDCVSKEIKNVPFKPKGAIHIVVYDKTNVPPPGARTVGDRVKSLLDPHQSLTFWWKVGALLDRLEGFADYTMGAGSWQEALDGVNQAVEQETKKIGAPAKIASLQFWGHGSPGTAHMGKAPGLNASSLGAGGPLHGLVRDVASHFHPQQGHVWFRCCSPFNGDHGKEFARAAAAQFGVPVVGHTFTIHALQSGTRVLRPGHQPDWDSEEGIHKHGRHKGEDIISGPLRRRTVTMFRLYPPVDEGEIILPAGLLAAVQRGISRVSDDGD